MKVLSLLGSTGSIGCNTLALVRLFPEQFQIAGLAAGRRVELLAQQVLEFDPQCISVADASLVAPLRALLPQRYHKKIFYGVEGACQVASLDAAQMVISAMVGAVGLLPALAAIEAGKDIGLANKETLVMAGPLIMQAVQRHGVRLFPIDSEHSAIFQALEAGRRQDVARLVLTASGGPFRAKTLAELALVRPEEALAHPTWSMGDKISIDSATLMNKGLEIIEARWLFDISADQIEVLIHPQSIVHSLVEYHDGSWMAQMGIADMRIPIAYALSYPERRILPLPRLDLAQQGSLDFATPDASRFPALNLAYEALRQGGVKAAVLNAANEVAVAAFLAGAIPFLRIAALVAETLEHSSQADPFNLSDILAADAEARDFTQRLLASS